LIEKKYTNSLYDLSTLIAYIIILAAIFFMFVLYIYQTAQTNENIKEEGYSLLNGLISDTRRSLQKGERSTFQDIINKTSQKDDITSISLYTANKLMTYKSNHITVGLPFLKIDNKFENPNLDLYIKTNGSFIRDDWSFSEQKMVNHTDKSKNCAQCHFTLKENLIFDKNRKAHIIKDNQSSFYYNIPIERYCINCHTHWKLGESAGYLTINMNNEHIVSQSKNRLKYFMIILGIVIISFVVIGYFIKLLNKKLKDTQKNLIDQANHDPMTKLYNRRSFYHISKKILHLSQRNLEEVYIIMLDIDNFKTINDTYGHDTGDKVIIELAKSLEKNIRKSDIAARWGGEEFIILFPNTNEKGALTKAENIRKSVASLKVKNVQFTVSIGVALFDYTEDSKIDDTIKKADYALYEAKNSGKNKVCQHI